METQHRDLAHSVLKILTMEPPFVTCVCELCDCGRHKHHKDCRKQRRVQGNYIKGDCYISHYKSTFNAPRNVLPRSSKRPLRTPLFSSLPPMNLATTQRSEFIARPFGDRTKPVIPLESYHQGPQEPMMDQTLYSLHYPPKEGERAAIRRPADTLRPPPLSKFQPSTTNKADYKEWKSERQPQYGELPAVAGSILFSGESHQMKTTTQDHFTEKKMTRIAPVKSIESHLHMEGEHDMRTTNQSTFFPLPLEKVTRRKENVPKIDKDRPQMETTTKYQRDFPMPHQAPEPSKVAHPPPDNLTVNTHYSNQFQTVQREAFPGWDPLKYPRPELAHLNEELSIMGRERGGQVDGNTVTKLAFLPPEMQPKEPVRRPRSVLRPLNAKFDGSTHSKTVFQDWGVQPRKRHGDPKDGTSLRPLIRLDSKTTTGTTFVPKKGEMVKNCKPEKDNLELMGERDFTTVHREAYRIPQLPECRMQIYLRQMREEKAPEGKDIQ
ncbi:stabilizer of axonemal microtubules 1-like [Pelobates fuscus]|uniref:stabilizer of axonemal microtubules 1-like n=1 Tax=Pelobates fuscus TaxID=191477 RepID=UPI002FE454BC